MDFTDMSDAELQTMFNEIDVELRRRRTLEQAPARAEALVRSVLDAEGVEPGQEWRPPSGAHDAYPLDWQVQYSGQTWTSLISGNVWEPGVSGWRAEAGEDEGPAAWVQPSGAHDAYSAGDRVTYGDRVYESSVDGNVWAPDTYGWEALT